MSQEQRDWTEWLEQVREKAITQLQAAERMEASECWMRKLVRLHELVEGAVVMHGSRGRASNRRTREEMRQQPVHLLRLARVRNPGGSQPFPGAGVLAGVERPLRATCGGRCQCPPAAGGVDRSMGQFEARRDAGGRQRRHDPVCRRAVSDHEAGRAGRDEAPGLARGTSARRSAERTSWRLPVEIAERAGCASAACEPPHRDHAAGGRRR